MELNKTVPALSTMAYRVAAKSLRKGYGEVVRDPDDMPDYQDIGAQR